MTTWRTYDDVAETYEAIHAPRFSAPARDLVAEAAIASDDRVLDLGSGTGIVAEAALGAGARVVGVDGSVSMLRVARRARPALLVAAGDAIDLPFRSACFDAVVGGFVISHFTRPETALHDVLRVLKPRGRVAFSVWADREPDAFERAWEELATSVVPPRMLASAAEEAVPGRARFARRGVLQEVLYDAGIRNVRLETKRYQWSYPRDDYVEGLGVWARGRFLRDMLGEAGWSSFLDRARAEFARRFPDPLSDFRDVTFAIGTKE